MNELLYERTEKSTIEIINNEIYKEEQKGDSKEKTYITRRSRMLSRNPKIAKLIKERAKYICESCNSDGFETKHEHGNNYMEAHHLKELAYGGEDKGDNMVCLCIECHGKIHHGSDKVQEGIYTNLGCKEY